MPNIKAEFRHVTLCVYHAVLCPEFSHACIVYAYVFCTCIMCYGPVASLLLINLQLLLLSRT